MPLHLLLVLYPSIRQQVHRHRQYRQRSLRDAEEPSIRLQFHKVSHPISLQLETSQKTYLHLTKIVKINHRLESLLNPIRPITTRPPPQITPRIPRLVRNRAAHPHCYMRGHLRYRPRGADRVMRFIRVAGIEEIGDEDGEGDDKR